MRTVRAVLSAAIKLGLALVASAVLSVAPAGAAWDKPWKSEDRALVIDAYEFNPIDWKALTSDKRVVGFINKASDGLAPAWNCRGKSGDEELLCKNRWWKYSVTKELYMTRRAMAKELGLKWGAYHLARPGNPREQADHFIDFAEPEADELIAIDIEDNTSEWMSLADAEIFANQIYIRLGRYPVLYTNGSTAKWISDYKDKYPLLSRLPLWYARYRDDITGMFPEETWPNYALWQFSSMHNCTEKKCPYRVKGAKTDIDVNVSPLDVAGLRAAWPFADLVRPIEPQPEDRSLVARLGSRAGALLASVADDVVRVAEPGIRGVGEVIATGMEGKPALPVVESVSETPAAPEAVAQPAALVAAYGPSETPHRASIDPLKLITETAKREREDAAFADKGKAPVKVASLGDVGAMKDEMAVVAGIVPAPAKPVAVAVPAKAPAFGPQQKSLFRSRLEAAAGGAAALPMPAFVLSQAPLAAASAGRGERPVAAARRLFREAEAKLGAPSARVSAAFSATR